MVFTRYQYKQANILSIFYRRLARPRRLGGTRSTSVDDDNAFDQLGIFFYFVFGNYGNYVVGYRSLVICLHMCLYPQRP